MNTLLISLSLALLAGLIMSRAAKLVNLPAVTSYLVAGLIIGPYVLNILNTQILDKTEMSKFDANTENNIPTKYDNPISDHLIPIKVEYLDSKTAAHSTL